MSQESENHSPKLVEEVAPALYQAQSTEMPKKAAVMINYQSPTISSLSPPVLFNEQTKSSHSKSLHSIHERKDSIPDIYYEPRLQRNLSSQLHCDSSQVRALSGKSSSPQNQFGRILDQTGETIDNNEFLGESSEKIEMVYEAAHGNLGQLSKSGKDSARLEESFSSELTEEKYTPRRPLLTQRKLTGNRQLILTGITGAIFFLIVGLFVTRFRDLST